MTRKARSRPTQTRIKHELLDRYLSVWGRIILNGVKKQALEARTQGRTYDIHLVYVDTNAFTGRYDGEMAEDAARRELSIVYGSAVIGVKALERLAEFAISEGFSIRTNAILIEKDRQNFHALCRTLDEVGYKDLLHETTQFKLLEPNEIAVIHGDWTSIVDELVRYTQSPYTFTLYLIDPYGPMAIPLDKVSEIVRRRRHDVIINMPYRDLHKKTGLAVKRKLTTMQETHCMYYDRMFGSNQWQAIVQRINPSIWEEVTDESPLTPVEVSEAQGLEEELVQLYRYALLGNDDTLSVKSIRLLFPAHEMTMYYLYLTTHDANGALKMNELIQEANIEEYRLRQQLKLAKQEGATGSTQLSLFGGQMFELSPSTPSRPPTEDVAAIVINRIERTPLYAKQGTITLKALYSLMADESFFASEIDRALTWLKHRGILSYNGKPSKNLEIRFDLSSLRW